MKYKQEAGLNVVILTCRQSPQRVNYYNALGKLCNLTVITERCTPEKTFKEYSVKPDRYNVIYLSGIPMFGYMAFCPNVIRVIRNIRFDVIIIEQYATPTSVLAIEYLYWKKIPFIISADSGFPNEGEKRYRQFFKKKIISKASLWITGGEGGVKYLEYYGADRNKIRKFRFSPYNRSDQPMELPSYDEKISVRNELGIKEKRVIVSVGQQIHRKGFDVLLKAVTGLESDVGVYILGGEPNEECKGIINQYSLNNVKFPGVISKEELKKYYLSADIFVFPTRYDIWGYPINEAMSFGLPIITTNRCNAGIELIRYGEEGYIVAADDVNSLRKCIVNLLNDKELRDSIGKRCFEKSKNYNSEFMAQDVYDIVNSFLNCEQNRE